MGRETYKYRNSINNSINQNHCNSSKPFANRFRKAMTYQSTVDESFKMVYQIDRDGKIRQWKSISEIAQTFEVSYEAVRYSIAKQKLIGDCLFIMMMDYKSTIDYVKLIKFLKFSNKN